MSNLMQDGAEWLGQRIQENGGRAVTYLRGSLSESGTATPKDITHEVDDEEGFSTRYITRSWIWIRSELTLEGTLIEPKPGDQIRDDVTNDVFAVLPIDEGLPCFEDVDSSGQMIVIHTKKV